jgi:hypothetical protein
MVTGERPTESSPPWQIEIGEPEFGAGMIMERMGESLAVALPVADGSARSHRRYGCGRREVVVQRRVAGPVWRIQSSRHPGGIRDE